MDLYFTEHSKKKDSESAFKQISESFILYGPECLRTSLVRCSARCFQQGAHDVDLLGLCHRGVDLCCHHGVDRDCHDGRCHGVDRGLRVACALAQRIPLASR